MATIQIRVDGSQIQDHVLWERTRFSCEADGNVGTATVVIDNTDRSFGPTDLHAGMTLELYVDGEREWDGWVMGLSRSWPFDADDTTFPDEVPRFWTLNGLDRNLLFSKRVMFDVADPSNNRGFRIWPEGTSDKAAIEYAIEHYLDLSGDGLSFDIEQIDSPSPWEDFTVGFVSAPMGVLFEDCSEMTGGVYWISDRTLHYKSDTTVTAPWVLSDAPTGAQRGYRDLDAGLDFTECATQAIVFGAGRGSADPVFAKYTNDTYRDLYGLWQWSDLYVGAWKQLTVDRRARTYVNGSPTHRRGHGQPVPRVGCTVFEPGIHVGMVVDFRATVFDYQEDLPVRKVSMSFPTTESVKYELELSLKVDTPFGIPDPWWTTTPDGGTPFRERIPPEGPGGTGGEQAFAGELIDHYDRPVWLWTKQVIDPITKGRWKIELPVVPDGIKVDDLIFIHWTCTVENTTESESFNGGTVPVRLWFASDPNSFWTFDALTSYNLGYAPNWGRYIRVTQAMLADLAAGDLYLYADGADHLTGAGGDQTKVGYVSGIVRGTTGIPGFRAGLLPSVTTGWFLETDPVTASPVNDANINGHDDYIFFVFAVVGGFDVSNNPIAAGQGFPGMHNIEVELDDIWTNDGSYLTAQVHHPALTTHPAFQLAYSRRSEEVSPFVRFPGSGPYPDHIDRYSTVAWGIKLQPNPLETPDQTITGARWEGGNEYYDTFSALSTNMGVSNSILKPRTGAPRFRVRLFDSERWLIPYISEGEGAQPPYQVGDIIPESYIAVAYRYPWSGFSTSFWSDGVLNDAPDLLIKWRFTGSAVAFATAILQVRLDLYHIPESRDGGDVWHVSTIYDIGRRENTDILMDVSPYSGAPQTWPDWGANPTSFTFPLQALRNSGFGPDLQVDTWYYTRIKVAAPTLDYDWFPYGSGSDTEIDGVGLPLTTMKTWPVDSPEPMSGTSDPFLWYWDNSGTGPPEVSGDTLIASVGSGWDIALPQAWVRNWDGDTGASNYYLDFASNMLMLLSTSTLFQVDAIWRYSNHGNILISSDVPVYDNTENSQSGTYITSFPYQPGSLIVWYQGIRLRPGIDYIESDPASGEFTIIGDRDISSFLTVEYIRAGSTPTGGQGTTGGQVYRPAPVLQYGWGTALDGYNCTMTCGCMAMDRHTLGQISATRGDPRATPPNMRSFQNDQVGGTDLFDVALAWQNGWSKDLQHVGTTSWSDFASKVDEGRGAILQGRYGDLPASKRFSDSFTGGHAIYINERFSNGNFWGIDPLYRYPVIYTASELQDYAIGFISSGLVSAAFTRITS